MFATVRNRRGVISAVEPFNSDEGRLHLVHLDYKDDQRPHQEQLLWEKEPRRRLLEPTALPDVAGPVRRMPVSRPFHDAVLVED